VSVWKGGKISHPNGFDPQTVDSVASHTTIVLLKIPTVLGSDSLFLSDNFPTFRKIAAIYFSNGILDPEGRTENSGSILPIMKGLLIKTSNLRMYIY